MWSRREFLARSTVAALGLAGSVSAAETDKSLMTPECQKAIDAGLKYLSSKQGADGSFGTGGYQKNVAITSLAGLAFLAGGHQIGRGAYGKNIKSALEFVLKQGESNRGGGAGRYPDGFLFDSGAGGQQGPMYSHGFGTLFLGQVVGMVPDEPLRVRVKEALQKAVGIIHRTQNKEGGWRYLPQPGDADISVTVCQIMALRSAKNAGIISDGKDAKTPSTKTVCDRCVEYVKKCQQTDGSFTYQANLRFGFVGNDRGFARSAAGVAALYAEGISSGAEIDKGLGFFKDNRLKHPGRQADMHYFYGHYYAVQCMRMAGGDHWTNWFPTIRDELIEHQAKEGHWADMLCNHYGTAMACIILQMPKNYFNLLSS